MTRKKRKLTAVFLGLFLAASLCAQTRLVAPGDLNAVAGAGQAEIIINAENSDKDIAVWVNGTLSAHVRPKSSEKIIVYNGQNYVEAADTTAKGGQWTMGKKKDITVPSNSDRVTIGMTTRYGALLNLTVQSTVALGGGAAAPAIAAAPPPPAAAPAPALAPAKSAATGAFEKLGEVFSKKDNTAAASPRKPAKGIEGAVVNAVGVLIERIPDGSTLAVLSISCDDPDLSDFVIEELVFLIVNTSKYKVVDRKSLDAVRAEHQFQYSGDVDDNSAVSIGKLLGASIVITGSISGSGSTRRLTAKALNVQTAEILAMARESY